MATASDTITRALRMINVVAIGETPGAGYSSDALEVLNDMLHGWAKTGVDLGHITMALGDTHRTHDSFLEGIRANLAVRLAGQYGRPVPDWVSKLATDSFAAFQAHTMEFSDDLKADSALRPQYFGRRNYGSYDFEKG